MRKKTRTPLARLRARLREAEETLRAIRSGEVDAIVVATPEGEAIYTLEGAERSYRVLVEKMTEGAVTLRDDGTVLYANSRFARLVGTPLERVIGASLFPRVAPEHRHQVEALLREGSRALARGEAELLDGGGSRVPVHLSVSPMSDEQPLSLCLVVTDLTEHKRAEVISASERFAQAVLTQAAEAIIVCDGKGRVLRASQAAQALCRESPLFRPFGEAFPLEYPGFLEASWSIVGAALRGGVVRGIPASLSGPEGSRRHLLLSAGPVSDEQERIQGCIVTLTDVTRLKAAEGELQTAVSTRDEFISIASHELRSPLTALQLVVGGLERVQTDEQRQRKLSLAKRQILRLDALIERVLTVSRIAHGKMKLELERLDLSEVTRDVVERLREEATAVGCELRWKAQPGLVGSWDRTRLEQVVVNLLTNALKYAPGKPVEVVVEARRGQAALVVSDHGFGISREDGARIFERFERAGGNRQISGLGLGLYITRQIVDAFGGTIEVASEPGAGAAFTVLLPRDSAAWAAMTPTPPPPT
ncbi:MAG: sensor histidine kinase [Myxococcaceae bacterium]